MKKKLKYVYGAHQSRHKSEINYRMVLYKIIELHT